jgi:hypothetical protein
LAEDQAPLPAQDAAAARREIADLAAQLKNPKSAAALAAVERLGEKGAAGVSYLKNFFHQTDQRGRRAVFRALGSGGLSDLGDWIFEYSLRDPLQAVRREAAGALVRLEGQTAAAARFIRALTIDPAKVKPGAPPALSSLGRLRAADLLAHIGGREAANALKSLLDDPDVDVAVAACEGLGTLGALENAEALIRVLARAKTMPQARAAEVPPAARDALEFLTGEKLGFDLVRWEEWLDARGKESNEAPGSVSPGEQTETYEPKYLDAYKQQPPAGAVDFAVIFDTTGSFIRAWPLIEAAVEAVLRELTVKTPSPRLGAVRYRASDSRNSLTYLIQPLPLTRDVVKRRNDITDSSFGGGSGGLHLGLRHVVESFVWRAGARRVVLIIGDVTPDGNGLAHCLEIIRQGREADGILFNAFFIRTTHGEEHKASIGELARAGGGRFYEYDRAWGYLVEQNEPGVNPKTAELPEQTLVKLLTPKDR